MENVDHHDDHHTEQRPLNSQFNLMGIEILATKFHRRRMKVQQQQKKL